MKVLAIDPGYGRCGVAVLMKEKGREIVLYSDCIETTAKVPFPERLSAVVSACAKIIKDESPDTMALEKLFFTTNQKTAMQVAEVRGALISLAAQSGLKVTEYTPGQ